MPHLDDGLPRMTRLQIYRLHAGLGQEELAELASATVDIIRLHEAGGSAYSGYTFILCNLARALAVEQCILAQQQHPGWLDLWEGGGGVWVKVGDRDWWQVSNQPVVTTTSRPNTTTTTITYTAT